MLQHSIPKCIGSLNLWIQKISFSCEFLVLFFPRTFILLKFGKGSSVIVT